MFQPSRLILQAAFLVALSLTSTLSFGREQSANPRGAVDAKSGMRFPARAGAFEREGGIGYDNAGYPEATYVAGRMALASVFYYKNLPFAAEYANCRDAVRMKTPSSRLVSDGASN